MQDVNGMEKKPSVESSTPPTDAACSVLTSGEICPVCGRGQMAYDGFLVLTCPDCGFKIGGGGFT